MGIFGGRVGAGEKRMRHRKRRAAGLALFDWLLILVIVGLLGVGVFCVLSTPIWWRRCLGVLDVRGWNHWAWTGVAVMLLASLAAIRYWPEKPEIPCTSEDMDECQ